MYRSQGSMGEYFAGQSGMGETSEYLQAGAGIGWMSQSWIDMVKRARRRDGRNVQAARGMHGALVDWARQEEAEAGHAGIFGLGEFFVPGSLSGMGEYFASNGLGVLSDDTKGHIEWYGGYALGGALLGLIGSTVLKKNKLAGAGIGVGVGLLLAYVVPPPLADVTPATAP